MHQKGDEQLGSACHRVARLAASEGEEAGENARGEGRGGVSEQPPFRSTGRMSKTAPVVGDRESVDGLCFCNRWGEKETKR